MKLKFLSFLVFVMPVVFAVKAQRFSQGLQLMQQNQLFAAADEWKKVPITDGHYTDALLGIALVYLENEHTDSALIAFQQFYKAAPDPNPYLYALWDTELFYYTDIKKREAVRAFMQQLINASNTPLSLKAMALTMMGNTWQYENRMARADSFFNQMGDLRNYSTVGSFDNTSSSGFNKKMDALDHPEKDYIFTNNISAPVKWFDIPDARNDRWLDYEFHFDINNAIVFAQSFIQSDADQDLTLLLGVSGSVKLWVNDFLVFSEEEERNTDLDVYSVPVKLQKGNNRILIQTGSSEISRNNFMIRFCDANGKLVSNLKSVRNYVPYTKAAPYPVNRQPFFAEAYFEKKMAAGNAGLLDQLLMAYVYNHNDKHYEAQKIVEALKSQAPKSTIISEALIATYSKVNNESSVNREKEFVKSNDPESLYGLILRYWEAMGKEDYEEAQTLLSRRRNIYGSNEDVEAKQLNLYAQKKDIDKMLKELEVDYARFPESGTIIGMEYRLQKSVYNDAAKADKVLEAFLKNRYDASGIDILSDDYSKVNRNKESMDLQLQLMKDLPYATMRYQTIADKYFSAKDYDHALEWQQKAIDRAPYIGKLYHNLAAIYDAIGKKEQAIAGYQQAIKYTPSLYDARKKLRELQGKKDLFSHFKQNDIDQLYRNSPKADAYPNSNSMYLLKESLNLEYPENGASEERDDYLIKILNQSGINTWKEVNIPYNSYTQRLIFYKTEILKKDGSKVKAETNENQIVFSTLEVGDAIHISYQLETSTYGRLSAHFWENFSFNDNIPVAISHFAFILPKEKKFQFKAYHFEGKPQVTDVDETYQLYEWEQKNNEAIEQEPFMPPNPDIAKRIAVSSIPDWNYVANWYSDLSYNKIKADFEIREKVKELLGGKEKLSDLEKAKIIYNYIEENFNYSNTPFLHSALTPQRASRTLNARLGDCKDLAVLFTSLAKEAGLDAGLVLVDTHDQGDLNVDIPSIEFNHCIARLHTAAGNYFVELTDNTLPFGCISGETLNSNALLIPKDGTQTSAASLIKLSLQSGTPNTIVRKTSMDIDNNGNVVLKRNSAYTGAVTSAIRSDYKNKSEEERKKYILKNLGQEFSNKVTLKSQVFTHLDDLKDSLQKTFEFSLENYSTEIAGMKIIKLPWSDGFSNMEFIAPDKRTYPLNMWEFSSTDRDVETLTIRIPAGKKWVEIPKNLTYQCPALSFTQTVKQMPDKLVITREVRYLKAQVPVTEYEAFKKTVNDIGIADKKQIAFH